MLLYMSKISVRSNSQLVTYVLVPYIISIYYRGNGVVQRNTSKRIKNILKSLLKFEYLFNMVFTEKRIW